MGRITAVPKEQKAKHAKTYYERNKEKVKVRNAKYRELNKEQRKIVDFNSHLKRKYNITLDEWNDLFEKQSGCCAICRKHQSEVPKKFSVDHCHKTGRVRGLLCFDCNTSLGKFNDDINLLRKAIDYLS